MVSQIQPPKTQMNPTLADLIADALKGRDAIEDSEIESAKLALNCLEERFNELIETKVTQMLKELRP